MAPNPDYVYCTICGMALGSDTVALAGPNWPASDATPEPLKVADQDVIRYAAEVDSYPGKLFILPKRQQVYLQHPYDADRQTDERPNVATAEMYIGIHAACEDIANRVIKTSFSTKVCSTGDLWLTLERRCASDLGRRRRQRPQPRDMNYVPLIPNNPPGQPLSLGFDRYYVPYHCIERWGDDWEGWWDEDPVKIPDLTSRLISNLEQLNDHSVEGSPQASSKEIKEHVCNFFQSDQFSLECEYTISQSIWKEIFFQIPFLWDLDAKAVYDKTGSTSRDIEKWNWEKLTRQVMSPPHPPPPDAASYRDEGIWDYNEVGLDVPDGFNNRRRIWQILEDMRLNDIQGSITVSGQID